MAEEQVHYEFVPVDSKDILADRQEEWHRFTQATTYAVGAIVVVLALMAFFLT